jgi:hypothetical protein
MLLLLVAVVEFVSMHGYNAVPAHMAQLAAQHKDVTLLFME